MTHALAGLLAAEAVCAFRAAPRRELRAAAWLVSALANNLPDIDIVYTWITKPKPLGSLLHHRGHTHTLLIALPAAWLLYRAVLAILARRGRAFSAGEKRVLLGLALAGPLLHLTMDYGNNYGVHPFWPLSSRWFYGDTIFIIEPLWWAVTIPVLTRAATARWLKLTLPGLLGALLLVYWFQPFAHPATLAALGVLTAVGVAFASWGSVRAQVLWAAGGALLVASAFAAGSSSARSRLLHATEASFPALEVVDIALTPSPANPACWEGLVVGEQGGRYRVLRTSVALPPLGTSGCLAGADVEPTATTTRLDRPDREGVRFRTEYAATLADLAALRRADCRFRAMLRFSRIPYVERKPAVGQEPAHLFAGDARYDRQPGLDFSDLELPLGPSTGLCPKLVPDWSEPRADVLGR